MALDQTANFVRGSTSESVTNSQTTIGVNDANTYPDPTNGNYNLVLWDDANYPRPDQDPDVEIVRVTGRDTTNNTITVSRGQESTTAVSHPSGSALHLSPTSAFFSDVASESQLGVTHVQTSEPAYSQGDTWLDPNTGIYRAAYDAGGGGDYHPVPPITVLDEAATFDESDVTLTHNKTREDGSHIELISGSSTATRGSDNGSYDYSGAAGMKINPNDPLSELDATISSNSSGVDTLELRDSSQNVLETVTGLGGPGATATFTTNLNANTAYYVVAPGSEGAVGLYNSPSYPQTSSTVDITAGYVGSDKSGGAYAVSSVTGYASATSGTVIIEWPAPSNIESWDLATFQRTLDNETVNVYVAESSDGGSTWSRVNGGSPIPRNFDISTIASANEVRIEVEISRANISNNPTLDYAARRFVR